MLRCDVQGRLVMKAFLSGMPDIKLGLNDKLEVCGGPGRWRWWSRAVMLRWWWWCSGALLCKSLWATVAPTLPPRPYAPLHRRPVLQDVTFHPCVNLGRFNAEKVVSFVPPDGEIELMKYRCTGVERCEGRCAVCGSGAVCWCECGCGCGFVGCCAESEAVGSEVGPC